MGPNNAAHTPYFGGGFGFKLGLGLGFQGLYVALKPCGSLV